MGGYRLFPPIGPRGCPAAGGIGWRRRAGKPSRTHYITVSSPSGGTGERLVDDLQPDAFSTSRQHRDTRQQRPDAPSWPSNRNFTNRTVDSA